MGEQRIFKTSNIGWSGSYNNVLKEKDEIDNWETQIRLIMDQIERTQSGRLLIQAIRHLNRKMLIAPDPATKMNASTNDTNVAAAFKRGDYSDSTGAGSCTIIELTPTNYSTRSGVFSSADTALFHEMCHGLHGMMGRSQSNLHLEGGFDNMDEFWAITLTNIYVSERHHPALRADHHGRTQLRRELCDSQAFYNWAPEPIRDMCESAPAFTRAMAQVPAHFNPLKVYYAEQDQ